MTRQNMVCGRAGVLCIIQIWYADAQVGPKYGMRTRRSAQNMVCGRADRPRMRKTWYADAQVHPKTWYADAQVSGRNPCKSICCVIFPFLSFIPLAISNQKRGKTHEGVTAIRSLETASKPGMRGRDRKVFDNLEAVAVYLHPADKSSMHSYVCTPQHEMGHLRTVFPIARSQEGHQSEDV
jgi:hypothetical protein